MPNPWTGIGNPYTKQEVVDRLKATLAKGEPIIAAGAGRGQRTPTPVRAGALPMLALQRTRDLGSALGR